MKNCVICGYYGQGNAGDEALLLSLLEMLPNNVQPIVLSGNPDETQKTYGVESYSRLSIVSKLNSLGKGDVFIWGGGSLMQDATSWRSPLFYAGLMAYAQAKGLTTIAWAQGIGPLNYSCTRWLAKQVLNKCDGVSVRDNNSAKLLADWQIPCEIAPDPVWTLSSQSVKILDNLANPKIAVNLRSHCLLTTEKLQILIQALILLQKATQATILVVPFQKSKDEEIAKEIITQIPENSLMINITDPRELKGLFQNITMVIGMRLHSLIMAAAEGCNCFALSYDPKVSILMTELNLPGYKLEELPSNPNLINEAWLKTYSQQKSLSSEKINSLKEEALLHKQLLQKLINNA